MASPMLASLHLLLRLVLKMQCDHFHFQIQTQLCLKKKKNRVVSPNTNILQPPVTSDSPARPIGNLEYINFGITCNQMLRVTTEILGKRSPDSVPGQADLSIKDEERGRGDILLLQGEAGV